MGYQTGSTDGGQANDKDDNFQGTLTRWGDGGGSKGRGVPLPRDFPLEAARRGTYQMISDWQSGRVLHPLVVPKLRSVFKGHFKRLTIHRNHRQFVNPQSVPILHLLT